MREPKDGRLIFTAGASRSGKTALTIQETAGEKRLLIWDPKAEWCRLPGIETVTDIRAWSKVGDTPGPIRAAFVPSNPKKELSPWALHVFESAQWAHECGNHTVAVADEVANATNPGRAQDGWHTLVSQGLAFDLDLYVLTQRAAEAENTSRGNAMIYRCFRQPLPTDRKSMMQYLDCPEEALKGLAKLEYLEHDTVNNSRKKGRLTFD